MRLKIRGTVSTLWASTSGRLSKTSASRSGVPLKSGMRFSTPVPGVELVDRADRLGVQPGAAVGQVVAGDAGDRGVLQAHLLHALGDPARLVAVERLRLAGVDLAEVAATRALVAADEEGRLAVLPALEDVGAAGLLADRVQTLGLHQRVELGVRRTHPRPGLDPLGLPLDRGLARCGPRGAAACARPGRRCARCPWTSQSRPESPAHATRRTQSIPTPGGGWRPL